MLGNLLRQRVEFAVNEPLDIISPCHHVGGFRVAIPRLLVSPIEVVTQTSVGVDARLDQLGVVLVQLSGSRVPRGERPAENTTMSREILERNDARGR